jgi:hypothetical protein
MPKLAQPIEPRGVEYWGMTGVAPGGPNSGRERSATSARLGMTFALQ